MSVKAMEVVWRREELNPTHRLVLLALADHADDAGVCYPSITRIRSRTGLSERAVQTAINALVGAGLLRVARNAGPNRCNVFTICAPAGDAPPQESHPRTTCAQPPQEMRPTPAGDAPKPSGTIKEPSVVEARKRAAPKTAIPEDAVLSDDFLTIAMDRGVSPVEAEAQFERFKLSAMQNARRYADWRAAWRNWLSSPYFKPITGAGHGKPTRLSAWAAGARR